MKRLIILTILCVSCGSEVKYRPMILGHDYKNLEIIKPNRQGRIYCGDEEFNNYASIHTQDVANIALVLKNAKVPWYLRHILQDIKKKMAKELEAVN